MQRAHILSCLTLLLYTTGCGVFEKEADRTPVAKVRDHVLYADELQGLSPSGASAEDSTMVVENHIRQWATQMLLMDKAELNLTEEQKNVSKQLEEYRRSLIIYLYEKQLVGQLLDTLITDEQVETYYNENKDNFELQDNIVRALFVKLDKDSKEVDKVRKMMRSSNEEKFLELEAFCAQHAIASYLNVEQWIRFDELIGLIPETPYLNLNYFSRYNYAHVNDSTGHYLLYVKEIQYKNAVSPLEFEAENIRNIILNQRKLKLVQKVEKDIFNEAVSKNQFEIFND